MNKDQLEWYTDYLTVTFGYATATGLSSLLDGSMSHDAITRFLSKEKYTSKDLWKQVKPTVREIESSDGVLIFDDSIEEKPHMDENELVCWHYDHSKGRQVKGINLLNCLYQVNDISIPVSFELIHKPLQFIDPKTNQEKRRSEVTKNQLMREMLETCRQNQMIFSWVLFDSWFSSTENFEHIKIKGQKDFIGALKSNRLVALTQEDQFKGCFIRVEQIEWSEKEAITGWLKGMDFPVRLVRQVFTNKDGSSGILYLACSKLDSPWNEITTIYKKRWKVEVFHKSLKSNAALAKSPARRIIPQSNHIFASIVAVFKMECLKISHHLNHFALRAKLYLKAIKTAFHELQTFKAA